MQVPRAAITGLEIGRGSGKTKGAIVGAVVGLASAVALGLGTGPPCTAVADIFLALGAAPGGCRGGTRVAVMSVATVPVGTLLGYVLARGEKWEASSLDRLRIAVAPLRGGGVRAAVTVRF